LKGAGHLDTFIPMTTFEQVPKNLREQMVERIAAMSERDVAELYELWLLKEKMDVRREMSDQAEQEESTGAWEKLLELVREYRSRKRNS
jgi:hypothetical protein